MISVRMHSIESACFVLSANVVQIAIREAENLKPFKDVLKETTFSCFESFAGFLQHLSAWLQNLRFSTLG